MSMLSIYGVSATLRVLQLRMRAFGEAGPACGPRTLIRLIGHGLARIAA